MSNLGRLGGQFSIPILADKDGYLGRECPQPACEGYFKVTPGTGLRGIQTCYCPYCGYQDQHDRFFTKEQIEYAKSMILNRVSSALLQDLKAMEFDHRPRGGFGIGISLKVTGSPHPIRYYREKLLETEVICNQCELRYAIYGVFAYCPDCGVHNSLQILEKNLELADKELALALTVEGELATHLIEDALENEIAAFDGFGREVCRVHAPHASKPNKAEKTSFQNLVGAQKRIIDLFGFNLADSVAQDEWDFACRCFQKRHLLAHKMGVIDEEYVRLANDPQAVVGRKVMIEGDEVSSLARVLRQLGRHLIQSLDFRPAGPTLLDKET